MRKNGLFKCLVSDDWERGQGVDWEELGRNEEVFDVGAFFEAFRGEGERGNRRDFLGL